MKKNKIIFWIATSIVFLVEGLMPFATLILSPENFNAGTKPLGYPDYFAYALIACKVLGSIALITPKLNPKLIEWAYAGLAFNLLFASYSHIMVDKNIGFILFPLIVGLFLMVSYTYRKKLNPQNQLAYTEAN